MKCLIQNILWLLRYTTRQIWILQNENQTALIGEKSVLEAQRPVACKGHRDRRFSFFDRNFRGFSVSKKLLN